MKNMIKYLENALMPLMVKVAAQKHLAAVRDGLIATIPITVISSIALLIIYLPWPSSYVTFVANNPNFAGTLNLLNQMGMGLLSLYVSFGIGSRLATSYGLDSVAGGFSALFTFLMTLTVSSIEDTSYIAVKFLGAQGMFTVIITAFLAVEVMRLCDKYNITIKLPEQVPANVGASFESLISMGISVLLVLIIVPILGFDINNVIDSIVTPLLSMSANSIFLPIIYVLLTGVMWFFGIHLAVLSAIVTPIWMVNAEANMSAYAAGSMIPNIGVKPFIFTYLWVGGGGGTLALCVLMMFSKSVFLNKLGKVSFLPGVFNINEPILFGAPIVLNPVLIIPFIVGPIIVTFVTYAAFATGIVPGMGNPLAAVWTVPSLFAGAIVTSSLRGALLVVVNFLIYLVVYYPFFKIYEKQMIKQEQGEESLEEGVIKNDESK